MRGVVLYGSPASGKDAVTSALQELDSRYVLVPSLTSLLQGIAEPYPVLHLDHAEAVTAVRSAIPEADWTVAALWCPQDTARERLIQQGNVDIELDDATLWLNTAKVTPRQAAFAIRSPGLVAWYEVLDPIVMRTLNGEPARNYGDLSFVGGSGRSLAHATSVRVRPPCVQDSAKVFPTYDLWALLPSDRSFELCATCVEAHPLP